MLIADFRPRHVSHWFSTHSPIMPPTVAACKGTPMILAVLWSLVPRVADRAGAVIPSRQKAGALPNSQLGLQLSLRFTPILFILIR
jgi:hypothetical protein